MAEKAQSAEVAAKPELKQHQLRIPKVRAQVMADLCGFTAHRLRQLEREGWFEKAGRDTYDPVVVLQGYIRFLQDDSRRSSKTAEQSRVQSARAREIELRNAREEGRLFDADDVETVFADILGTFRSELSGVPAASTRDLALRANIEKHLNAAVDRCRDRFTKASETLRAGGEVGVDAEDADA